MLRILYGRGEKKGKVKNPRIIKIFGRVVRITVKIFPKFLLHVENTHSRARVINQAPIVQKMDSTIHFTG